VENKKRGVIGAIMAHISADDDTTRRSGICGNTASFGDGHFVWRSPNSLAVIARRYGDVVCPDCAALEPMCRLAKLNI